jgi:predicted RNA-binding protein with PUA-like domain
MNYWLLKTEPGTFSWADLEKCKTTHWDGVRNFQARNFLMQTKVGDLALFYHSGKERAVVGIVKIIKTHYPDPSDKSGKFVMVDVEYVKSVRTPVTLSMIKQNPKLQSLPLVKQSRLSVMPIPSTLFNEILKIGN